MTPIDPRGGEPETAATPSCPVCGRTGDEVFFSLREMPLVCNVLLPTREAAQRAPAADIELVFCPSCGMIYNRTFDDTRFAYGVGYENALHFSPRFRQYAEETVDYLIDRHDLHACTILDIGCGDGHFLDLLCTRSHGRGIGVDPSMRGRVPPGRRGDQVTILAEEFSPGHLETPAQLICCRHVLEHLGQPSRFLRGIRSAITQGAPALYFEVPNGLTMLRTLNLWDVIYEHCSYFTPLSLVELFRRTGFEAVDVTERYGKQFLSIEAKLGEPRASVTGDALVSGGATAPIDREQLRTMSQLIDRFSVTGEKSLRDWRARLMEIRRRGERAVVWGAGAKGVTFLNGTDPDAALIDRIVDVNPRKQGKFVPCSGQRVIQPEELAVAPPSLVIVMNDLYIDEITQTLDRLGLSVDLAVA